MKLEMVKLMMIKLQKECDDVVNACNTCARLLL